MSLFITPKWAVVSLMPLSKALNRKYFSGAAQRPADQTAGCTGQLPDANNCVNVSLAEPFLNK